MPASEHSLSVVIVNWNSGDQLRNCLQSLEGRYPAVVVDNGSVDGSCEVVSEFKNVTLIEAHTNLGFGKACNLGARYVDSDYLLFLNPDAKLYPDSLDRALSWMRQPEHSQYSICSIQMVDGIGNVARSCARFPTAWTFFAQIVGVDKFLPKLALSMVDWSHSSTRTVDHVIGAFYLVRRRLFDELNGFDETFFLYFEDLDFSYRAKRAGALSVYLSDAQAFHAGGGTSNQIKAQRLFYVLRSRILYAHKHFSRLGCLTVCLSTFLVEPFSRSALSIARRSGSALKETWQAYLMLWQWLPKWIFRGVTR